MPLSDATALSVQQENVPWAATLSCHFLTKHVAKNFSESVKPFILGIKSKPNRLYIRDKKGFEITQAISES